MALIHQLDETYPDGSVHKVYVLDDDLRDLKKSLKETFPGVRNAITATHTELNYTVGLTNVVQDQIDALGVARQGMLSRGEIYGGKVSLDGTADVVPDGWTTERESLGNYLITLPAATTIRSAQFNIDAVSTTDYWRYTIAAGNTTTTTVEAKVVNANSGSAVDAGFYFQVHTI